MLTMSRATAALADAMESCAGYVLRPSTSRHPRAWRYSSPPHRMKGPSYEQGTRLQAAAGLHHLMGNHWHVLVRGKPFHATTSTRKRPLTRRPPVGNAG